MEQLLEACRQTSLYVLCVSRPASLFSSVRFSLTVALIIAMIEFAGAVDCGLSNLSVCVTVPATAARSGRVR